MTDWGAQEFLTLAAVLVPTRCGGAHGVDSPPVHYPTRREERAGARRHHRERQGRRRPLSGTGRGAPCGAGVHRARRVIHGGPGRQNATGSEPPPSARPVSARGGRLRAAVLERDDYRCRKCRIRTAAQVHHLVPVARGGAYFDPGNLIAVCRPCHRELHDTRTPAQREWDAYLREL